eukprot:scaffold2312_cov165-Ochromonas_danica.AAC.15
MAEAAAEALMCGFVRDVPYHMLKIEANMKLMSGLMDVIYRSQPNVQTHLMNLLFQAIDWAKSKDFVLKILDMGLVNLINFMLKGESVPTQDASIQVILALLKKVHRVKDLLSRKKGVLSDLTQTSIIEILAKITLRADFVVDSPLMWTIVEIWSLLAVDPNTHQSLFTYVSVSLIPRKSAVGGITTNAVQRILDLLNALSDDALHDPKNAQGLLNAFNILSFVLQDEERVQEVIQKVPKIIFTCLKILTHCTHTAARSKAVDVTYRFTTHASFSDAVGFLQEKALLLQALVAAVVEDNNPDMLNVSMDLIAFVVVAILKQFLRAEPTDLLVRDETRELLLILLDNSLLWDKASSYFEYQEKTLFVARLLHVLGSFKDIRFLTTLYKIVEKQQFVSVLLDLVAFGQNSREVSEMIFLALGSLFGSSAYFPWDHVDILSTRTSSRSTALRDYQKTANLDMGSSLRALQEEMNNPLFIMTEGELLEVKERAKNIWMKELNWRRFCVQKAKDAIRPFLRLAAIEDHGIVTAALRVIQIILRDGAEDEDKFHLDRDYYAFVAIMPSLNTIEILIALDVFGLMTGFAPFCEARGVELVCTFLQQSHDPLIKTKAVETIVYCSLNAEALHCITHFAIQPLGALLRLPAHVGSADLDSNFLILSVLLVILRLAADEKICSSLVKTAAFVGVLDILRLDSNQLLFLSIDAATRSGVQCTQKLDPFYRKAVPTMLEPQPTIVDLAYQIINCFARVESCRSILIAANLTEKLFERLNDLVQRLVQHQELPNLLEPGSFISSLDEDTIQTLYTVFALTFKPHSSMRTTLLRSAKTVESIFFLWAAQDKNISYMSRVILTRCSVVKDNLAPDKNMEVESNPLWAVAISTQQLYFISEVIDDRSNPQEDVPAIITFDEFTDAQAKTSACVAMLSILQKSSSSLSTPSDERNFLSKERAREVISFLCSSNFLKEKLRRLKDAEQVGPQATALLTQIDQLLGVSPKTKPQSPKAFARAASFRMANPSLQPNEGYNERRQTVRDLVESLRNNRGTKASVLSSVSLPNMLPILKEMLQVSSLHMLQSSKVRSDTENLDIITAVIDVVLVIAALYEFRGLDAAFLDVPSQLANNTFDLRDPCELLLVLCCKRHTAALIIGTPFLATPLVDSFQLYLHAVESKAENRVPDELLLEMPELRACKSLLVALVELFRFGAAPMTEKLVNGGYLGFLSSLMTLSPGRDKVLNLPPCKIITSKVIKSEVVDLQNMTMLDQILMLLVVLVTTGKTTIVDTLLEDGTLIEGLSQQVNEEVESLLTFSAKLNELRKVDVPIFLSSPSVSSTGDENGSVAGGMSIGGRSKSFIKPAGSDKSQDEQYVSIANSLAKKVALLANLCRSKEGGMTIIRRADILLRLLDILPLLCDNDTQELLQMILLLFERLAPVLYPATSASTSTDTFISQLLKQNISLACTHADLRVIDQSLTLAWRLIGIRALQPVLRDSSFVESLSTCVARLSKTPPLVNESLQRCLSILCASARLSNDLGQFAAIPSLLENVVSALLSIPRTSIWLPATLQAAEVVNLLVTHPTVNVVVGEIFQRSNYQIGSEPQETSHVLLSIISSITNALQPMQRSPVIVSTWKHVFPSPKDV